MLRQAANDYLTLRRELGFKLVDTGELLASFTSFAAERGDQVILVETALKWAACGSSVQRRHRRLRTLELFVEHLRAEDTRHERLPMDYFPPSTKAHRYPPRIFSVEEIARVLSLTARLHPVRSIRPLTYRTLIGLLDPYLTHHMDTPFPSTLTTTVFSQCRSGRFGASPCRQTPEGHDSSITSMASHTSRVAPASPFRITTAHANTRAFASTLTQQNDYENNWVLGHKRQQHCYQSQAIIRTACAVNLHLLHFVV